MSAVNGTTGAVLFNLSGTSLENLYGRAVLGLGDMNGDGRGDLAVGAPNDDPAALNSGRTLFYEGGHTNGCALGLVGTPSTASSIYLRYFGSPAVPSLVVADLVPGPVSIPPYGTLAVGLSPALLPLNDSAGLFGVPFGSAPDTQGSLLVGPYTVDPSWVGITIHTQAFGITAGAPNGAFQISNGLSVTFIP